MMIWCGPPFGHVGAGGRSRMKFESNLRNACCAACITAPGVTLPVTMRAALFGQ